MGVPDTKICINVNQILLPPSYTAKTEWRIANIYKEVVRVFVFSPCKALTLKCEFPLLKDKHRTKNISSAPFRLMGMVIPSYVIKHFLKIFSGHTLLPHLTICHWKTCIENCPVVMVTTSGGNFFVRPTTKIGT